MMICFSTRYIPLNSTVFGTANLPNMEDTSIFSLSGFQYIFMAVVVTKGHPHKKLLYHNCKKCWYFDRDCFLL